ncbi:MAG: ABC transporter ATP-binding protein [Terriglobales bacterium]
MPPFFQFLGVSKSFGDRAVLEEVSFDVGAGECVCIVGRSGVGKSVTLKLLMGFLRADGGQVCVQGTDLATLSDAQLTTLHQRVTLVFQSGALFDSLTVGENVAFPLRERGVDGHPCTEEQITAAVSELLGLLELQSERDLYPGSLSTGMKRAVAIARALAAHPQAILYDEPTTMVDPIMAHSIAQLILRVKRQLKLTSVIVTHDTHFARMLADRLVLLHEGRVRFFGTIAEMDTSTDPVLRDFLRQDELALP